MSTQYTFTTTCDICGVDVCTRAVNYTHGAPVVLPNPISVVGFDACDGCAKELHDVINTLRELHKLKRVPDPIKSKALKAQQAMELLKYKLEEQKMMVAQQFGCAEIKKEGEKIGKWSEAWVEE